jgi:hypothetical protein
MKRVSRPKQLSGLAIKTDALHNSLFVIRSSHAFAVTVLGLSAVNASEALGSVLDGRSTLAYWLQTGLIAAYFALLLGLYAAIRRAESAASGAAARPRPRGAGRRS